jgi:hypothetical protein
MHHIPRTFCIRKKRLSAYLLLLFSLLESESEQGSSRRRHSLSQPLSTRLESMLRHFDLMNRAALFTLTDFSRVYWVLGRCRAFLGLAWSVTKG